LRNAAAVVTEVEVEADFMGVEEGSTEAEEDSMEVAGDFTEAEERITVA
jgi:hypothetical protein